jgi:hypothetical protein
MMEAWNPGCSVGYFAMVLDFDHDLMPDDERLAAVDYLADELTRLTESVRTVAGLAEMYAKGKLASALILKGCA